LAGEIASFLAMPRKSPIFGHFQPDKAVDDPVPSATR
jgi:hypothetical protein